MSPDEARSAIKGYASVNRIVLSSHARKRMAERGALYADIRNALITAVRCEKRNDRRWRVDGKDLDGDGLTVVVVVELGVVVVTMF